MLDISVDWDSFLVEVGINQAWEVKNRDVKAKNPKSGEYPKILLYRAAGTSRVMKTP